MSQGKIYGEYIESAAGEKISFDSPIEVNGNLLPKCKMKKVAAKLGMSGTSFVKGGFVTTLDDIAKFVYAIMNDGVYGGDICIKEGDREKVLEKMIALYGGQKGDVRLILDTNMGELAVLMNVAQKNAEFVINK
jgi:hypothetical protein